MIHRFYPPKHLHRHCFRFPLGHLHVPGEIAHNDYAKFWGVKEVDYGICASREFVTGSRAWPGYIITGVNGDENGTAVKHMS